MVDARFWIPTLFAALALIYGTLALLGTFKNGDRSAPAQKTRLRIAAIFAAVSAFLYFYL